MTEDSGFQTLLDVMKTLRGPKGCPWDRKQTNASIKRYLIEEAYEALEALNKKNWKAFRDELGDLLFQIVFQSEMAEEAGRFKIEDVIRAIRSKLVNRHPHVFGKDVVKTAKEQTLRWDDLKAKESPGSILERVPKSMPALMQARELQSRAHRLGFKWINVRGVKKKIHEEIEEWVHAAKSKNKKKMSGELGDLLFMVVNLSRWLNLDAEEALQSANQKFRKRFNYLENEARNNRKTLKDYSLPQLESLWKKAKRTNRES